MHDRSPIGIAPAAPDFLSGGGEMGALMRAHDWAATPLGTPDGWPEGLKTLVGVMLGSNQPMFVAWGRDRTLLYNGAYTEILARKHPTALGRDFLEVWHEIRADLLPIVEQAYAGESVHMDHITLIMSAGATRRKRTSRFPIRRCATKRAPSPASSAPAPRSHGR